MNKKAADKFSLETKQQVRSANLTRTFQEFKPAANQYKEKHKVQKNLREVRVSSGYFSRIKPKVYIKTITVDDNPDSSAFLDEQRNPHISIQTVKTRKDGSVRVARKPATINAMFPASSADGDEEVLSVKVDLCVKQLFDDDNTMFEVLQELGVLRFLRVKIVALTNKLTFHRYKTTADIHLLETLEDAGVYVVGGQRGIPIPSHSAASVSETGSHESLGAEIEMTSDGELLKTTMISRSFEFARAPEDLIIFAVPYFDIFSEENKAQLDGDFEIFSRDPGFRRIFVGDMVSEVVFEDSALQRHASIFTRDDSNLSMIGQPYSGDVIEVRPGLYATASFTTKARSSKTGTGGHVHFYYVDRKGNGWTNVHRDNNGIEHVHMIKNFKVSQSGKFSPTEDKFTRFKNGHGHALPIAASNALYKKKLPINYIIDNRARNGLKNMKLELDKDIEDAFSFLKHARRRSNLIKPISASGELSAYTTRNSQKVYYSPAYFSMDVDTNCSFSFAFDHLSFAKDNTSFGKYISNRREAIDHAPIHSVRVFRKRINHYEEAGMSTFRGYNFEYGLKEDEQEICYAKAEPGAAGTTLRIQGVSEVASLSEITPALTQKSSSRHARYFLCTDKTFSLLRPVKDKSIYNVAPSLSSGIYVYGIEVTLIDNTLDFFAKAQSDLFKKIKKLENYIAIGRRRENHSGVTRQFTKAFSTPNTNKMAEEITSDLMVLLRKIFVNNSNSSKTPMITAETFKRQAAKMYQLIRPKTGNLYAAERYLSELSEMMGYLKGITGIEDVGKYKAAKSGANPARRVSSNSLPDTKNSKLIRRKHFFKETFKKEGNDLSGVSYFSPRASSVAGLVEITPGEFEAATRLRGSKTGSSFALLVPKYAKIGSLSPESREINEELMYDMYYKTASSKIKEDTFEIVHNQSLLANRSTTSTIEGASQLVSLRGVFGESDIQDQLFSLQDAGLLRSRSKEAKGLPGYRREARQAASGEELTLVMQEFLESNLVQVEYFKGFSMGDGLFRPQWRVLTLSAYKRTVSERRPMMCRLRRIASGARFGHGGKFNVRGDVSQDEKYWLRSFGEVFLITDARTNTYSPTSPRQEKPLSVESAKAAYDSEFVTSDPKVVSEDKLGSVTTGNMIGPGPADVGRGGYK